MIFDPPENFNSRCADSSPEVQEEPNLNELSFMVFIVEATGTWRVLTLLASLTQLETSAAGGQHDHQSDAGGSWTAANTRVLSE